MVPVRKVGANYLFSGNEVARQAAIGRAPQGRKPKRTEAA